MSQLNRRQWLRRAGWGSALTLLAGTTGLATAAEARVLPLHPPRPNTGPIRLSSNENPYGPSPAVRKAMTEAFDDFCRYPFAYAREMVADLAKKEGVSAEHIVLTGGSTEGLCLTGLAYGLRGGEVIAPHPTFLSLMDYAEQVGAYIHRVPLTAGLDHDLEAMEGRITGATRLIFVCNPNNPTGVLIPTERLERFISAVNDRGVVFVDEAYIDYVEDPAYASAINLVKQGANVIVSRTFSKVYGLAGLRLGYLIARPDIAERLRGYVMANAGVPAIIAGRAALADTDFYRQSLEHNREAREYLYSELKARGLRYVPSHANFVFFHTGKDIRALNADMRTQGVLVGRPFPPLDEWCRVSTGRMEDMEVFAEALKKVL